MEKRILQRGSVRRFRVSGTDEQNYQRARGRRASIRTPAFPGPCPLYIVQDSQARRLPCFVGVDGQTAVVLSGQSLCYMSVC